MPWTVEVLNEAVAEELEDLGSDLQAKIVRVAHLLETLGPSLTKEPYVKHLEGKLWEMRAKGKDGIARAIYMPAVGQRFVILHAFTKKTQKTPKGALETATRRGKEAGLL